MFLNVPRSPPLWSDNTTAEAGVRSEYDGLKMEEGREITLHTDTQFVCFLESLNLFFPVCHQCCKQHTHTHTRTTS